MHLKCGYPVSRSWLRHHEALPGGLTKTQSFACPKASSLLCTKQIYCNDNIWKKAIFDHN